MQINITDESFKSVIVIDGQGELSLEENTIQFIKGDSIFVPAQNNSFQIEGKCKLIISYI